MAKRLTEEEKAERELDKMLKNLKNAPSPKFDPMPESARNPLATLLGLFLLACITIVAFALTFKLCKWAFGA